MRPDPYTKAVLTVIAGCLLWLCAMQTGRPLAAQQALTLEKAAPQPVVIVGWGTLDEQGTARVDGVPEGHVDITFPDLDAAAWERT